MLVAAFHLLRDGVECRDLVPSHLDRHDKARTIKRLVKRLRDLGCTVEIPQAA
jgi:transposase